MEEWRDISGFSGYQVSNLGRVRTFWKRKHYPTGYGSYNFISDTPRIMSPSDDGNGYMKVMLYCKEDGHRYCKKIHRLVAEAFLEIPTDDGVEYTVDHIESGQIGKLNNSVDNLRWLSRSDNIKKAYRDGVCNNRIRNQNKMVLVTDTWAGEDIWFESATIAAKELNLNISTVIHAVDTCRLVAKRYLINYIYGKDRLLYGEEYNY